MIFDKLKVIVESGLSGSTIVYYVVIGLGFSHLFYMFTIFSVRLAYVLYYIYTGKWIHRNSPVKYLLSQSSAVMLSVQGVCLITGSYFTLAAAANSLDAALQEPYFIQSAIIKEPAVMLKGLTEAVRNNVRITFGPKPKPKPNLDISTVSQGKILSKVQELQELELGKFKSLLDKEPELKEVFAELKRELARDIISDLDK